MKATVECVGRQRSGERFGGMKIVLTGSECSPNLEPGWLAYVALVHSVGSRVPLSSALPNRPPPPRLCPPSACRWVTAHPFAGARSPRSHRALRWSRRPRSLCAPWGARALGRRRVRLFALTSLPLPPSPAGHPRSSLLLRWCAFATGRARLHLRCLGAALMMSSTRRIISAASVADAKAVALTLKASQIRSCATSPTVPRTMSIPAVHLSWSS